MQALERLIDTGTPQQILDTLRSWQDKERRAGYRWAQAFWKAQRPALSRAACRDPFGASQPWWSLTLVGTLLARTPKEALAIPVPHDLSAPESFRHAWLPELATLAALFEALAGRERDWLGEWLALATGGKNLRIMLIDLVLALHAAFALPLPETPEFFTVWAGCLLSRIEAGLKPNAERKCYELLPQLALSATANGGTGVEATMASPASLAELGRAVAGFDRLLAGLLAQRDGIRALAGRYGTPQAIDPVAGMIAARLAEGSLDRACLLGQILSALSRSDAVSAQQMQARLLCAAAGETADYASHAATLQGLLPGGHGTVAETLQELLRRLDADARLDAAAFHEICAMIFARKEKGLRETQFDWIRQRLATYPAQREATLRGLLAAFDVDDFAFRKKAVLLFAGAWNDSVGDARAALLPVLDDTRARLEPELAHALPGSGGLAAATPADSAYEEIMPRESHPLERIVYGEPGEVALRELQARYDSTPTVALAEQMIDMTLRLLERDEPAACRAVARPCDGIHGFHPLPRLLAEAVCRQLSLPRLEAHARQLLAVHGRNPEPEPARHDSERFAAQREPPTAVLARLRFYEIARSLALRRRYPLLSRPTWSNGSIAAEEFIAHMQAMKAAGSEAGEMDLLVALLRCADPDPEQIAALRALDSRQAGMAADFFAAGGVSAMHSHWQIVHGEETPNRSSWTRHWLHYDSDEVMATLDPLPALPPLRDIPCSWAMALRPESPSTFSEFRLHEDNLNGVLPNHGEVLAALNLWGFRKAGHDTDSAGGKEAPLALPVFLMARGPAGPALHLALLFSLSANAAEARLAGSDGLLELIAQQRYNSGLAAELAAAAVRVGSIKLGRLAKSLAPVVNAGAGRALWPLLSSALSSALTLETIPTGAAELLALAHRLAALLGQRGSFDALARTAARKGSSKLLVEARRLHALLESPNMG